MAAEKKAAQAATVTDNEATAEQKLAVASALQETNAPPEENPLAALPGPERFDLPRGRRPAIECKYGAKAVAVPEASLAVYYERGWQDAYVSSTPGRPTAGIVEDETRYHVNPAGRLMQNGSFILIMRADTHARLLEQEKQLAKEPLLATRRKNGKVGGKEPEFFSVAYRTEDGVRPAGAIGALVRDDDDE